MQKLSHGAAPRPTWPLVRCAGEPLPLSRRPLPHLSSRCSDADRGQVGSGSRRERALQRENRRHGVTSNPRIFASLWSCHKALSYNPTRYRLVVPLEGANPRQQPYGERRSGTPERRARYIYHITHPPVYLYRLYLSTYLPIYLSADILQYHFVYVPQTVKPRRSLCYITSLDHGTISRTTYGDIVHLCFELRLIYHQHDSNLLPPIPNICKIVSHLCFLSRNTSKTIQICGQHCQTTCPLRLQ